MREGVTARGGRQILSITEKLRTRKSMLALIPSLPHSLIP